MNIIVSFSGGRTSAYMGWWLKHHTDHELMFVFMNTGCEHEKTLEFLDRCDKEWDLNLVWLEAVVNPEKGKGTKHKVVTFETASRNGEPMEDVIRKYGLPNQNYIHCTRETKLQPVQSWVKENGIQDYKMAIGIRADEIDRVNSDYINLNLVYPLITMNTTTENNIMWWWSQQDFDLGIHQYEGNCRWCYKKTYRKLATIAKADPVAFDFPARMEREYADIGLYEPRSMFRGNRTTQDVLNMVDSVLPFNPTSTTQPDMFWDETGGCSESCEVY